MPQQQTKKKTIHEKLLEIQRDLKAPKNQFNKFGGYYYRSAEDIIDAVKPLLCEKGLIQTISDEIVNIGDRYYVKATVTVTDGENEIAVSAYARESEDKKGQDSSQITGATSSYARKYAMNGIYAIDDTKDSDATNKHGKGSNSNLKRAVNETKDQDLSKGKSQMAYQVALQKFKDCQTLDELEGNVKEIIAEATQSGLTEKDKKELRKEYQTIKDRLADDEQESSGEQSTRESQQANS